MAEEGRYNKKRLLALAVLIVLLIIVLLLFWWWFFPKKISPTATPATQPTNTVVLPVQKEVIATPPVKQVQQTPGEAEILSLARNFTERYGSWSTDSEFQNLIELFPRVTDRLKSEFEQTIRASSAATAFRGIQTKVLQMSIDSLTASTASALVTTQRVSRDFQLQQTVRYQNLALTMVKQGNYWYVDSATWK